VALLTASALFSPAGLHAQGYTVSNLVADLPGAANIDTNLVNAWGLAILSKDMLIVNANENSIAGLYGTDGKPTGSYLAVNSAPSGLAVNRGGGFKVTDGQMMRPSTLIFITENGTILGWSMNFTHPTAGMFEPGATVDADGSAGGD
jgi:hypothetical protein